MSYEPASPVGRFVHSLGNYIFHLGEFQSRLLKIKTFFILEDQARGSVLAARSF